MDVRCIDRIDQFDQLERNWTAVYEADPHATIFVSWPWLAGLLETFPNKWLILAARPHGESGYVAFLPLAVPSPGRMLSAVGNPLADHTGFVCVPEYQEEALEAFATFAQRKLNWDRFWMREVMDPRLDLFLCHFSPKRFQIRQTQTPCPCLSLPGTWEGYLQDTLVPKKRNALRRYLRQLDEDDRLKITLARADRLDQRIETLFSMWQARWGAKKAPHLVAYRAIFDRCFEHDSLYLATMWHEDTPIATRVSFVDRQRQTVSAFISGWDRRFRKLSPGNTLQAHSIRVAAQSGMRTYDLLRGSEPYKYSVFGAKDRFNTNAFITRKSLRLAVARLGNGSR
jgi:CelD/BcsL family acetyltransferase involved in cellulose biosynthesis